MSRVLVTGWNSFVGTNFIKYSKFRDVNEVSLFAYRPGKIDFRGYDVILHLVAIVHQTKRIPEEEYFKINRDLTIMVAREAKTAGVKQFILMSTVKVYGSFHSLSEPWNESSECFPDDAYGRSKLEAEIALRDLKDENFKVAIIRTPLVYGEGVRANMKRFVSLVRNSYILPFRDIHNKRNFTSIENLVAFIDRIIELQAAGTFIAMDKGAISTSDLIEMISENLGKKLYLFKTPDLIIKLGMKIIPSFFERIYGSYEMDNSKTLEVLDFKPPFTTQDEIKKMIETFLK
jgi:UDP-glucose 4-epimerase